MDESSRASVALLMLDIASAKSTLAHLQHTYNTATTEHQRTLGELDTLRKECGVSSLYATGSKVGHKVLAQQLQALHTENIQLKSLLKQECSMRQRLEHQHAALLQQLRNYGLDELLLGRPSQCQGSRDHANQDAETTPVANNVGPLSEALKNQASSETGADQTPCYTVSNTSAAASALQKDTCSAGAGYVEAELVEEHRDNNDGMSCQSRQSCRDPLCPAVSASSAYFPSQHQNSDSRPSSRKKEPMYHSAQHANIPQQQPIAMCCQASKGQLPLHHQLQEHLAPSCSTSCSQAPSQAQQSEANWQPNVCTHHLDAVTVKAEHLNSLGNCSLHSLSSSSSQTAASELDSDDLEELAGLCDGLISEATKQPLASMAALEPGPVPCRSLGSATSLAELHSRHTLWQQAGGTTFHCDQKMQDTCAPSEPNTQQPQAAFGIRQHRPNAATSVETFAAELQRLQQQAASVGIDTGAAVAAVNAALGALHNKPAFSVDVCSSAPEARASDVGSGEESGTGNSGSFNSSSHTTAHTSLRQSADAAVPEGSDMASLQQQLAARMVGVKQRLSSICSMRLEAAAKTMGVVEPTLGSGTAPLPFTASQANETCANVCGQQQPYGGVARAALGSKETRSINPAAGSGSSLPTSSVHIATHTSHPRYSPSLDMHASSDATAALKSSCGAMSSGISVALGSDTAAGVRGLAVSGRARVSCTALWPDAKQTTVATTGAANQQNSTAVNAVSEPEAHMQFVDADKAAESDSDSSWDTVDDEQVQQQDKLQIDEFQQQEHLQANHHCSQWCQNKLDQENMQHRVFQTPTKQQQYFSQGLHQYGYVEQQPLSYRLHKTPQQPYAVPVAEQDQGIWPAASMAEQHAGFDQQMSPFDTGTSSFDDASIKTLRKHTGTRQAQPLPQQLQVPATDGLEGVLFGLKGRVTAEVSQTFSPLKAASGAGCGYVRPGSPATPLKPRNL